MKIATVRTAGNNVSAAVIEGHTARLLNHPNAVAALAEEKLAAGRSLDLAEVEFLPPSPCPPKIICIGLNYRGHVAESGEAMPRYPSLFAKYARTLVGPYDPIVLPVGSKAVDWEVELAIVIGRNVRNADEETALKAIGGYTVLNDVSARDFQFQTSQWMAGKIFEKSTPVGPSVVTPEDIDHARDLEISCMVDETRMQYARTSDLIFKPMQLVSFASSLITLEVGDIISTGTPAGVGSSRTPPVYLKEGNRVRSYVEGIGELDNLCVAEAQH